VFILNELGLFTNRYYSLCTCIVNEIREKYIIIYNINTLYFKIVYAKKLIKDTLFINKTFRKKNEIHSICVIPKKYQMYNMHK